jgi:endonuclease/exonuclease/phosphatase family metal-dependent hydrolase
MNCIVCMQEFLNLGTAGNTTLDTIKKQCRFKYHYFEKLEDGRKKGEYGMVILSKYEITGKGLVDFDQATGNMCIYADIKFDTGTYRIYNMHLQSFRFLKKDYKFIVDLPEDNQETIEHSKNMLSRMKHAYIKRSIQAHAIKKHFRNYTGDYFLIGDFNDPPVSYSYHLLSKNLKDAFVENGNGMGKTYIGVMPNFRIDYILYPNCFKGLSYKAHLLHSDHKLVETEIIKDVNDVAD